MISQPFELDIEPGSRLMSPTHTEVHLAHSFMNFMVGNASEEYAIYGWWYSTFFRTINLVALFFVSILLIRSWGSRPCSRKFKNDIRQSLKNLQAQRPFWCRKLLWILVLTIFPEGESTTFIQILLYGAPLHLGAKKKLQKPSRHLSSCTQLVEHEVFNFFEFSE